MALPLLTPGPLNDFLVMDERPDPRTVRKAWVTFGEMRTRIAELEETIAQLRDLLRPKHRFTAEWHLDAQSQRVLALLYDRDHATFEQLRVAMEPADAQMSRAKPGSRAELTRIAQLRKALAPRGITIKSLWGVGYYLDAANKQKVKAGLLAAPSVAN